MSAGETGTVAVGVAAVVATPVVVGAAAAGVAVASAAVGAAVAVGAAAVAAGVAVGVAGAVVAAGAAAVGAVGYGLLQAGQGAAEAIKIAQENREQVKKATGKYLESLKEDEAKCEEFVKKGLEYIEQNGQLYTKDEAEKIVHQEQTVQQRVDKVQELLELTSEYEMVLENLSTVRDMALKLNIDTKEIDEELKQIEQAKNDLGALRQVLNNLNEKIINWIREQEQQLLDQAGNRIFTHESWKIVSESRDVIACIYQDDIVELFEKSNDREIAEARLKIEINDKRLALIKLYDALSNLRGFPLFEEEARKILTESLYLFQTDHPDLTDSGIDAMLNQSLAAMLSIYNSCVEQLGKELVEAKIKYEDALALNKAYRIEMRLPHENFIFDEDDPEGSADKVIKNNEQLHLLYENMQKNKVWMNKLNERFRASGYIYVVGGRVEMIIPGTDVVKVTEYYLTPDEECVVIVSTYSDGRPMEIVVEGIKLNGLDDDKEHIKHVQKKHCEKSGELLDGLVEGEITRYEPSDNTAVAIELENLPAEYRERARQAREKRNNKNKGKTSEIHKNQPNE